ncbi:TadE family protein [Ornithinimicrobium murale]|uniref:TadE family protein n=1 Tax=Ornithinimicrobium murale TaxID=1050153 RepID=UPI000E0D70A8|nr:TadE family protein [Ornithinimicrobium murale]
MPNPREGTSEGRRRIWFGRRDAGAASVEMVVLASFLFMFTFAVVQGGLWFHARSVALGAAQEGARVAAAESSSGGAGAAAAADFVADAGGGGVLLGAATSGTRTATTATVVVTGQSQSIVFFWDPTIVQTASVPVERITG